MQRYRFKEAARNALTDLFTKNINLPETKLILLCIAYSGDVAKTEFNEVIRVIKEQFSENVEIITKVVQKENIVDSVTCMIIAI